MMDAPCKAPCTCLVSGLCPCCAACYWRKATLETYANGMADYECCQGYMNCPCCPLGCFKGTMCGLCLEGCCCDTISMSISRIFVMDHKDLRPDPTDYQIIRCSNCLQITACVFSCIAAISGNDACRDASNIINLIAECVVRTVMGCMAAQIKAEITHTTTLREVAVILTQPLPMEAAATVPKAQVISRED
jgi:hypothetical protein